MNDLNLKKKYLIIFFIIHSCSFVYCQKWNQIDDSTYNTIVKNRFDKGNFYVSLGGRFVINYYEYDDYNVIGTGLRTQVGYFLFDRWLLTGVFDFYDNKFIPDSGNGNANYFRVMVGPQLRYYLKPKSRSFYFQINPFAGKEYMQISDLTDFDKQNDFIYGGTFAVGISVFIRHFEFEANLGAIVYSNDYSTGMNSGMVFQLNISYIFTKNNKIRIHQKD